MNKVMSLYFILVNMEMHQVYEKLTLCELILVLDCTGFERLIKVFFHQRLLDYYYFV